jgi:hypothetical protein
VVESKGGIGAGDQCLSRPVRIDHPQTLGGEG